MTDPTQLEEFLDFIWGAGFIGVAEGPDVLRVSLPYALGDSRTAADGELFLELWLAIGIRVWNGLSPEREAVMLEGPGQLGRLSHG